MSSPLDALRVLAPALAFLLAAVPLAALLDELGFFDAASALILARTTSVLGLWVLAAVTTVVLNLDTTIVLLTPLYLRIARRGGTSPLALCAVPLLLASLASSALPVSNLTTLIIVGATGVSTADVVSHLALPSAAAVIVGWLGYRRRFPVRLGEGPAAPAPRTPDTDRAGTTTTTATPRRALRIGGVVVAGVLVGFTLGARVGMPAWLVALSADAALVVVTRTFPWRRVPLLTAMGVAVLGVLVALVVEPGRLDPLLAHDRPLALLGLVASATVVANVVNNLPATLLALSDTATFGWGQWAWLLGVNVGAVLLPIGAVANLLWWRIVRAERLALDLRTYVSVTAPIALPAIAAAALVLAVERVVAGG